jgi:hypothetical protein
MKFNRDLDINNKETPIGLFRTAWSFFLNERLSCGMSVSVKFPLLIFDYKKKTTVLRSLVVLVYLFTIKAPVNQPWSELLHRWWKKLNKENQHCSLTKLREKMTFLTPLTGWLEHMQAQKICIRNPLVIEIEIPVSYQKSTRKEQDQSCPPISCVDWKHPSRYHGNY